MKKYTFFFVLNAIFCANIYSQKPIDNKPQQINSTLETGIHKIKTQDNAKVTGYVVDSMQTKPVDFANVSLFSVALKKVVDGTVCDEKGKFSLKNLKQGEYKLQITFLGYKNYTQSITLEAKQTLDLGVIKMVSENKTIEEVVVQGQRSLIEEKVDRTVYNAEKDQGNKGGDAADVLRKVPMLSVDLDGNVMLRGNSNVKVLINNKPSTIMATSIADALKQIPADMIKTVEVITSPSAKYDAEGSSGIINIVTKKNNLKGFTLSKDISFGIRGSNLSLNGSLRTGKMGFSLGGFGRASYNTNGDFVNTQQNQLNSSTIFSSLQSATTRNNRLMGSYQLGYDWDITKNDVLTFGAKYGVRNQQVYQDNLKTIFIENTNKNSLRDVEITDNSSSIDMNLDYSHTFKKPQQTLNLSSQFSLNNRTNDFTNIIFKQIINSKQDSITFKNKNPSDNQEISFQADFQNPIGDNQLFEIGVKNIIRNVFSKYNQPTSGELLYNQNVAGTYFTYSYLMKSKWTIKIGGRYEYTSIDAAETKTNNLGNLVKNEIKVPQYGVFVPSINISKTLKGGSTLKVSFNQRIQRPSLQYLNPNQDRSNPLSISEGNPSLTPEYSDNYEISLSSFIKQTYITTALFVRNTTESIEAFRENNTNEKGEVVTYTTFKNIGSQKVYGANFFGNIAILKKIQIGGGLDMYYSFLKNNNKNVLYSAQNQGFVLSGRVFASYNFNEKWGLQSFGYFRGQQVQLQGNQGGFSLYSLSLKRDFNNKKGSLGFGAENFFTFNGFKVTNTIESPTISQKSVNTFQNLNFKVNFSYRFGKISFSENRKKTKSINNDDQKDAGSSNDTMGGGNAGSVGNSGATQGGGKMRPSTSNGSNNKKP